LLVKYSFQENVFRGAVRPRGQLLVCRSPAKARAHLREEFFFLKSIFLISLQPISFMQRVYGSGNTSSGSLNTGFSGQLI
jgi:hypothetical protein